MNKNTKTQRMMKISILSALAFIVMLIEFPIPLPFFPPFLKIDFSDVIVLFAGFSLGGVPMLIVTVVRSILHWFMRGAQFGIPIDQLASMLSTFSYTIPLYLLFKTKGYRELTRFKQIGYILVASISMSFVMFVANYFVITPYYFKIGGMALPDNYLQFMLAYIPFNLIKGALIGGVVFLGEFIHTINKYGHKVN